MTRICLFHLDLFPSIIKMSDTLAMLVAQLELEFKNEELFLKEYEMQRSERIYQRRATPLYKPEGFPELSRMRRISAHSRPDIVNNILLRHCPEACPWLEKLLSLPLATEKELRTYAYTAPMGLRYAARALNRRSFLHFLRNFVVEQTDKPFYLDYKRVDSWFILYEWEKNPNKTRIVMTDLHPEAFYAYLLAYFGFMQCLCPNGKVTWVGVRFPPIFDDDGLPPCDLGLAVNSRPKRIRNFLLLILFF